MAMSAHTHSCTGLGETYAAISLADDEESATLVRECRELEEAFGTHYADMVLRAEKGGVARPREMKEEIMREDMEMRLARCSQNDRAPVLTEIARPGRRMEETVGCCIRRRNLLYSVDETPGEDGVPSLLR